VLSLSSPIGLRLHEAHQQLKSTLRADAVSRCTEVKQQTPSSGQKQGCHGLICLRAPGCFLCECFPINERVFEHAGIVFGVAEGKRVEFEGQAQGGLRGGRAHTLPIPAQKIRERARLSGMFEPCANAGVSQLAQAKKNFAHQSFARFEMVDKHAGIRFQRFGERAQG